MKKILTLILTLSLLFSLASCRDDGYEKITYREEGIEFFLPSSMRRSNVEGYHFYFSNLSTTMVFAALKVDSDLLAEFELDATATAGEYVDAVIAKGERDKEKMYFEYDERLDQYSFRYTYVDADDYEIFYYVVVTGDPGNIWYVEMCCENEYSSDYLSTFVTWRKNIRTYTP